MTSSEPPTPTRRQGSWGSWGSRLHGLLQVDRSSDRSDLGDLEGSLQQKASPILRRKPSAEPHTIRARGLVTLDKTRPRLLPAESFEPKVLGALQANFFATTAATRDWDGLKITAAKLHRECSQALQKNSRTQKLAACGHVCKKSCAVGVAGLVPQQRQKFKKDSMCKAPKSQEKKLSGAGSCGHALERLPNLHHCGEERVDPCIYAVFDCCILLDLCLRLGETCELPVSMCNA